MTSQASNKMTNARSRGFSLIELITVIAVIGILFAIMFPALAGAREKARKKEKDSTSKALQNAITAFHAEYGYWPCPNPDAGGTFSSTNQHKQIIDNYLLSNAPNNPRRVTFWETAGVVYNYYDKRPFVISISATNTYDPVQVY